MRGVSRASQCFPPSCNSRKLALYMSPRELARHKNSQKQLLGVPDFKRLTRGKLPKPFHKMGSPRLFATNLIKVSDTHCAVFMWRDGETRQDAAFMAWLFCVNGNDSLYPLFELHFHPSHKGVHCKTPCRSELNYINRQLPGAWELNLRTAHGLDPRSDTHRKQLILQFCHACGISVTQEEDPWTLPLA